MIKAILRYATARFGRRYDYNVDYMIHVLDVSNSAAIRLSLLPAVSQYRGPKRAKEVWAGAILASTMDGDCGPCAQLVLDMAIEAGVPADKLRQCVNERFDAAGDVGLGFRFAQAAIAGTAETDALRAEIISRHGEKAAVAAAFAASSGRVYPVLKRGLGYGHACQHLRIDGQRVPAVLSP